MRENCIDFERKIIMGLFKNYINQTRKPEGVLGKAMLNGMNSGHAKMDEKISVCKNDGFGLFSFVCEENG